ncbi:MAG: HD domain-containing phosphohydrolase [Desulfatibacillaceae bacterium]
MEGRIDHTVLLVDDEKSITNALKRLFRKESFTLYTAGNGEDGIGVLKTLGRPVSLIISDQRMPVMDGVQFLEKAQELAPHAIRFLLTGYSDLSTVVDAVNKGQIHRYLTKPWDDNQLVLEVRQALTQYDLVAENRRLFALTHLQNRQLSDWNRKLEQRVADRTRELRDTNRRLDVLARELEASLYDTVCAFSSILRIQSPALSLHCRRVGRLSRDIALRLGLSDEQIVGVEIAALLHDIGLARVFRKLADKADHAWDEDELAAFRRHPEEASGVLESVGRLSGAARIVRHHHERVDGQGFPHGLAGDDIPLGSRILAVADAWDWIVYTGADPAFHLREYMDDTGVDGAGWRPGLLEEAAVHHVTKYSDSRFDSHIVNAFLACRMDRGCREGEAVGLSGQATAGDSEARTPSATRYAIEELMDPLGEEDRH